MTGSTEPLLSDPALRNGGGDDRRHLPSASCLHTTHAHAHTYAPPHTHTLKDTEADSKPGTDKERKALPEEGQLGRAHHAGWTPRNKAFELSRLSIYARAYHITKVQGNVLNGLDELNVCT